MPATETPRPLGMVLVHGGFHQSSCFALSKTRLEAAGFSPVVGVDLPSVGTDPYATLDDDARSTQAAIEAHVDAGRESLALAHSCGGTPLTIAALFGGASVGLDELRVPAYYILCEKDQTIAPGTQEEIIATIRTLRRGAAEPWRALCVHHGG